MVQTCSNHIFSWRNDHMSSESQGFQVVWVRPLSFPSQQWQVPKVEQKMLRVLLKLLTQTPVTGNISLSSQKKGQHGDFTSICFQNIFQKRKKNMIWACETQWENPGRSVTILFPCDMAIKLSSVRWRGNTPGQVAGKWSRLPPTLRICLRWSENRSKTGHPKMP